MSSPRATFHGEPLQVRGQRLAVGDRFPDAVLSGTNLKPVALNAFTGVRLFSVIPSLATGICDAQTRRFDATAQSLGHGLSVITVSTDLPFTLARWQKDNEATHITLLSDHKTLAFGDAIGAHVIELRLLQRCVFVVDAGDIVRHAEYVGEIAQHPDYDAAIDAVTRLLVP